jgi:outer membrane protein OmpA-like peptidoglycan-associated protein
MNWSASMILAGVLAIGAPALAAEPAAPSASDYVKEIQTSAAQAPAAAAAPSGACENGEERDSSGACPVVDDGAAQRGFTLFSGSMAKPQSAAPKTATSAAVKDVRAGQSSQMAKCGLLCDLKVNFKPGSSELTADSEVKLERFADALRDPALAHKRFEIGGHTDASGSAEKNLALSQARAESVKDFLVAHGVASSRLQARGYGAEGLLVPDQPRDPRNRRVEARVLN